MPLLNIEEGCCGLLLMVYKDFDPAFISKVLVFGFSRQSVADWTVQFPLKLTDFGRKVHSWIYGVSVLVHVCSQSPRHSASPNYGRRKQFPETEGTYECNEQVIRVVRTA